QAGTEPTTTSYTCADTGASAVGVCEIPSPQSGGWHVLAHRVTGSGEVQVTATSFGAAAPDGCVGDCDGSGAVGIADLIPCVNVALGARPPSPCAECDASGNGAVEINELIAAVNAAFGECSAAPGGDPGDQ